MSFLQAGFNLLRNLGGLASVYHGGSCISCTLKPRLTKEPIEKVARTIIHLKDLKLMHVCLKCWNETNGSGDPDIIHLEVLATSLKEARTLAQVQKIMSG